MGCKAAAGNSEVVGVLLGMQEVDVRIPEFQVSVSAAGDKHLAAGGEAAGHHAGLADRTASEDTRAGFRTWPGPGLGLTVDKELDLIDNEQFQTHLDLKNMWEL